MMEGILYTLKNYQGLQRVFVYMDNIFICIVFKIKIKMYLSIPLQITIH